ncbi:MAG: peptidoglycan-binding protein [Hyalangium sp.]|uniref:peptidoglycan-binding protein n=1 Tax=Hyalangium sp. TaxID=2028555 RepID=UPI00389B2841
MSVNRTSAVAPRTTPRAAPPQFDGSHPAPGTTNTNAAQVTNPPVRGSPSSRNRATYDNVINQFGVGSNPRYTPRDSNGDGSRDTFCNIFLWDVTRAMGAEIPHWVDSKGNPAAVGKGRELNANATVDWLHQNGPQQGWHKVSAAEAQKLANEGHPAVAVWKNPSGIGHVAVVRPGEMTSAGPAIAQAGASNFNNGHVKDSFGTRPVEYFVNDGGKVSGNPTPTPTPTPPSTGGKTPVPQVDLRRGAEGAEVKKLQDALVKLGYMTKAQVATGPGIFGPKTEAAVSKFQADKGISPASGIFGPKTRAAMEKALGGTGGTTGPGPVTNPGPVDGSKAAKLNAMLKGSGLQGKGEVMLAMAKKYNVPVELALAMFKVEAQWNTTGVAPKNNNPGNLRFAQWESELGGVQNGGFTKFPTLDKGIEAYFRLLGSSTYRKFVDAKDWTGLVNKYAPPSDGNDSSAYSRMVTSLIPQYQAKLS